MGVVTNLFAMDPESAAIAAQSMPSSHRVRIERTDGDLFPEPLLQRPLASGDPVLPEAGEAFELAAWGLQAAGRPKARYVVDEVVESAFIVSGVLVIEHLVGVKEATWLDEAQAGTPQ
jgi:hypothetical protein